MQVSGHLKTYINIFFLSELKLTWLIKAQLYPSLKGWLCSFNLILNHIKTFSLSCSICVSCVSITKCIYVIIAIDLFHQYRLLFEYFLLSKVLPILLGKVLNKGDVQYVFVELIHVVYCLLEHIAQCRSCRRKTINSY